ncbi:DUF3182 family protein [Caballeronia sp. LZ028]|uniref:DUF3182 family protein n=1 Tax=Caballeronia sp. LZ028 TaxID=3038563 RepID=UPI00285460D6|nr:DUF3182 family protein [Caballeronia sp. LZ028]MDR5769989.1 DUF3182 family protein [Caballeronia sp. LZ028]
MHTPSSETPSIVVVYSGGRNAALARHEIETQRALAGRIAALLGSNGCVEFEPGRAYPPQRYFVPVDTLPSEVAQQIGVTSDDDLFGGVVPFPFIATKVVVHGLPPGASVKPDGWDDSLADRLRHLVLPGFSAFTADDAHAAAALLAGGGSVRLKRPSGIGGTGQAVIADRRELASQLKDMGAATLLNEGVVLERNLPSLTTFSVGEVHVRAHRASYCGVQRLTRNNHGHSVYGGSDLVVVRGGLDALERTPIPPEARSSVECAREFDAVIRSAFPGFIASRRNYDVASGIDEYGHRYRGVLEQSWRIGGASGAEIGALQAFADDPALTTVCASSVEIYGGQPKVPAGACIVYQGVDAHSGLVTKLYTVGTGIDAIKEEPSG